ncbi:MAG: hypothetical protein ACK5HU_03280 [Flavobacteriales bacterium]
MEGNAKSVIHNPNDNTPEASTTALKADKEHYYGVQLNAEIEQKKIRERDKTLDVNLDLVHEKKEKNPYYTEGYYDNTSSNLEELERLAQQVQEEPEVHVKPQPTTKVVYVEREAKKPTPIQTDMQTTSPPVNQKTFASISRRKEAPAVAEQQVSTPVGNKTYKAKITGTRQKKNYVTKSNNRVYIENQEAFMVNGHLIKKYSTLVARVVISNEMKLKIQFIQLGDRQIPCDIEVIDTYGQPSIEVIGGTGEEAESDVREELSDEIGDDRQLRKIPGASSLIRGFLKGKTKVKIRTSNVRLKIN